MAWQEKLPDDVKWGLVAYTRGMGLEVGCGPKTTFPHFIGVDSLPNSGSTERTSSPTSW
jgi:hypothetical protein